MIEMLPRIWENLGGRVGGPLSFRLILQPIVAGALAIRAGVQDARTGRPAYAWAIFTDKNHRHESIREGWKAVARVFGPAVIMDIAYQLLVFRWVYPVNC
jgi:hypothetical protein